MKQCILLILHDLHYFLLLILIMNYKQNMLQCFLVTLSFARVVTWRGKKRRRRKWM